MSLHSWLQYLYSALASGPSRRNRTRRGSMRAATHRPNVEALEDRRMLALERGEVADRGGGGEARALEQELARGERHGQPAPAQ